jgi:hypothetical protein
MSSHGARRDTAARTGDYDGHSKSARPLIPSKTITICVGDELLQLDVALIASCCFASRSGHLIAAVTTRCCNSPFSSSKLPPATHV